MENDSRHLERPCCFQCTRRRVISHHMTLLLPLIMLLSTVCHAMCPARCQCNDEDLHASCTSAGLQVVPIQLNPELKHINVSFNKIDNVHFTLGIYANLISLDVSHNRIQKLGALNFISQGHLSNLQLNSNEIEGLEKDVFKGLKSLVSLDLSSNRIEEISPVAFIDMLQLEILNLNQNKIVSFEPELFKHQTRLRVLKLNDNQLLEIPANNLEYTSKLEHLSMSRNLIENVEESSFPVLKTLKYLSLDTNIISEIHGSAFDGFSSLETLNLADNNFTVLPTNQLSKLSNLTELNLSGNFFLYVPPVAFRGLFKLKHLFLNRIDKLVKIDVRAFVDNINLEYVSMNDNIDLGTIPTRLFHGNPKITHISMKNNVLQTLEATHFPLDQLISLQIADNPLECNCSLMWLWKLVTDQKGVPTERNTTNLNEASSEMSLDVDGIRCAGPDKITGILLIDLPESEVRCSPNWIAVATGSCTAVFVLAIVVVSLIYSGVLRKCSGEKQYLRRNNIDAPYQNEHQPTSDRQRSRDKCEHMIGPPLLSEYQTLPPWETYPANKEDIYRQFGYHSSTGHTSKPHIVYV